MEKKRLFSFPLDFHLLDGSTHRRLLDLFISADLLDLDHDIIVILTGRGRLCVLVLLACRLRVVAVVVSVVAVVVSVFDIHVLHVGRHQNPGRLSNRLLLLRERSSRG